MLPVVKNLLANAGDLRDTGLISGFGRFPGEGNGNPLQYSGLENPMDRGAWRATVHSVAKRWTLLKRLSMQATVHKGSLFSTPSPVVLPLIFILPILIGVQWYFILVFICTSLVASDAEHLFLCIFAICIWMKCLFMSFAHFLTELYFFFF